MKVDQAKRIKEVEKENARLRKLVADLDVVLVEFWGNQDQPNVMAACRYLMTNL